ncbi:MAG: leucine-rich repeat domain-containing protein [Saprospiraceae bacterium]|nr:leucine-rich repeat domain-containing protein [Saprospiraceae bacterium]
MSFIHYSFIAVLFISLVACIPKEPTWLGELKYIPKVYALQELKVEHAKLSTKYDKIKREYDRTFFDALKPPAPIENLEKTLKMFYSHRKKNAYQIPIDREMMRLDKLDEFYLYAKDWTSEDSLKFIYQAQYANKIKLIVDGDPIPYIKLDTFKNLQILEIGLNQERLYRKMSGPSINELGMNYKNYMHRVHPKRSKVFFKNTNLAEQQERLTWLFQRLVNNKHLEILVLDAIPIHKLPKEICQLESLRYLVLGDLNIDSLPDCICELKNLEILKVYINPIRELPKDFGQLLKLKKVEFTHTGLEDLPNSFTELENLEIAVLTRNRIRELPEKMNGLKKLKQLDLENNHLFTIPESVSSLDSLQDLNLKDNNLKHIPKGIGELPSLVLLNLAGNRLESLPKSLKGSRLGIDLSYNEFTDAHKKQLKKYLENVEFNEIKER